MIYNIGMMLVHGNGQRKLKNNIKVGVHHDIKKAYNRKKLGNLTIDPCACILK
jgi:hypothetical protein